MVRSDRIGELRVEELEKPMHKVTKAFCRPCAFAVLVLGVGTRLWGAEVIELHAKETLTALEMNRGDELRFRLRDGRLFTLVLEDTHAAIVEKVSPGGIVYRFSARVCVDGQPMTMERYVCCQECFYEPYVIGGVRIWLDIVKDVFDLIPIRYPRKGNLQCMPRKAARLALQDAALRICPQQTHPWIEDDRDWLDVGACYNGDDCYLGPYLGQACHVGMDINHAKGSPLFAPVDFDSQAYFNSLAAGHNNNRWRGIRRWENGDVWALQSHHLIRLLVPENTPLRSGVRYATTAGVHVGSHEHTHFEFKIGRPRNPQPAERPPREAQASSIAVPVDFDDESQKAQAQPEVLHLDPWIVFWQIFEDRKARRGAIRAAMKPRGPAPAGVPVDFSAEGSRPGPEGSRLTYHWAFGDGASARGPTTSHVFARPGVYPVTLIVEDRAGRAATTQHAVVTGDPVESPVLALAASDEPAFRPRPVHATDVYGRPVRFIPNTLEFVARRSRPAPQAKTIRLENLGGGELTPAGDPSIEYGRGDGWLVVVREGSNNGQSLDVTACAAGLGPGEYSASVQIACPGALNSPQQFRVELRVLDGPAKQEATVDDGDPGFYATPCFWVGHRFCRYPGEKRGYGGFYLTNGGRPTPGEFARFTPDLQAGRYEVSLSDQTPFRPGVEFDVRVRHAGGDRVVRVRPEESRGIGTFEFDEGTHRFVEIRAEGSRGLVIADAVTFRPEPTH